MRTFWKIIGCVACIGCGSEHADTTPPVIEPSTKPLPEFSSTSQLSLLASFVKLTAQLRFHHPSDAATNTVWDELMLEAAYQISSSKSTSEAELRMWQLLAPILPDLQLNGRSNNIRPLRADETVHVWQQNAYTEVVEEDLKRQRLTMSRTAIAEHPELPQTPVWRFDDANLHAEFPVLVPADPAYPTGQPYKKSERFLLPHELSHSAVCVATVAKYWSVIDQFFPYFQQDKQQWQAEIEPLLQSCHTPDRTAMYRQLYLSLQGLNDAHIEMSGPGLDVWHGNGVAPVRFAWLENRLVAVTIKAGTTTPIQLGDQLLTINNTAASSYVTGLQEKVASNSHLRRDQATSHHLLRGSAGQVFELTLQDGSGKVYSTSLNASEPVSFAKSSTAKFFAPVGTTHRALSADVYYLDASRLNPNDYNTALSAAATAKALVVDLRAYPQQMSIFTELLPRLCKQPTLSSNPAFFRHANADQPQHRYRQAVDTDIAASPQALQQPIVGLMSRFSISANEHVISYLKRCNVPFVGEQTVGANGDTTRITVFPDQPAAASFMVFTAIEITQPDGGLFHGVGITPNLVVAPSVAGTRAQQDEQLDAALALASRMVH